MIDFLINLIGYLAAIVGTLLMLPQVIKSWQTKKVRDISFFMVIAYVLNCALWLAYGVLIASNPLMLANGISLIISLVQLYLKNQYDFSN